MKSIKKHATLIAGGAGSIDGAGYMACHRAISNGKRKYQMAKQKSWIAMGIVWLRKLYIACCAYEIDCCRCNIDAISKITIVAVLKWMMTSVNLNAIAMISIEVLKN